MSNAQGDFAIGRGQLRCYAVNYGNHAWKILVSISTTCMGMYKKAGRSTHAMGCWHHKMSAVVLD